MTAQSAIVVSHFSMLSFPSYSFTFYYVFVTSGPVFFIFQFM